MNENSQQVSFHLVLPFTSSHEIFAENHAGKFTVMLPKEIHLDQNFHWEMALVELFGPKQDSVAVIENLWYETQGPNRRWKRNNTKRSHTQLDSRKQVIAFQDRVMTININEAQHPLK